MRLVSALLVLGLLAAPFLATPTAADPLTDAQKFASCYPSLVEDLAGLVDAWVGGARDGVRAVKCKLKVMPTGVVIASDADFVTLNAAGVLVTNKAKGVIGGSGTASDPYLVLGHEWNGQVPTACPALTIRNTQAHVLVTGNWFHDLSCDAGPVVIEEANNVRVEQNRFSHNWGGIRAASSGGRALAIRENVFEDTYLADIPSAARFGGNFVEANAWYGSMDVSRNAFTSITGHWQARGSMIYIQRANLQFNDNAVTGPSGYQPVILWYLDGTSSVSRNVVKSPSATIGIDAFADWHGDHLYADQNRIEGGTLSARTYGGDLHVRNNVVYPGASSHHGISVGTCASYTCGYGDIRGNDVRDYTAPAFYVASGRGYIEGNLMRAAPGGASLAMAIGAGYPSAWQMQNNYWYGTVTTEIRCYYNDHTIKYGPSPSYTQSGTVDFVGCNVQYL